jgi:hypothetical protein
MPTGRLYLVRRDSREFIGPMLIGEFQQRLARMEFGLQDEVSGHCGPWIVLDQKDLLTMHYPEVAALLGDSLPLSWREVTGHAKVISRQDTRKDRHKKAGESKSANRKTDVEDFSAYLMRRRRHKNFNVAVALGFLVCAGLLGLWFAGKKDDLPNPTDIASLASKSDSTEFLNVMGLKVVPFAPRIVKNPKTQATWIPFLRMYAFSTNGAIDGVSSKYLRGDLPTYAPADCSVEVLKRKWRENAAQVALFTQGRVLAKNPWTKLLAMDPNWARRRSAKGWIKPRNYYEACLMAGSMAIRSVALEPGFGADPEDGVNSELLATISRRIQSQLEIINSGKTTMAVEKSSLLGSLTCLDNIQDVAELDRCKVSFDPQIRPLLDERTALALVRVAVNSSGGAADGRWMSAMNLAATRIMSEDVMSRADLSPESKLIGYLLSGSTVEQAIGKTETDNQEIRFR